MRFTDIVRLALGQLRVNPLRTAFTLLGIVVSVGFLVAVVAIIQGMNAYVKENIADAMIGVNTFQVRRMPISLGLFNDEEFRLLRRRPRVDERDAEAVRVALPDAQAISLQSGWPTPQADVVWRNRTLGSVMVFGVTAGYQVVQDYKLHRRPAAQRHRRARAPQRDRHRHRRRHQAVRQRRRDRPGGAGDGHALHGGRRHRPQRAACWASRSTASR